MLLYCSARGNDYYRLHKNSPSMTPFQCNTSGSPNAVKMALAHWNENSFHVKGFHWNCRQFSRFDGIGLRKSTRVPELVITPWGVNKQRITKLSSVQDRLLKLYEYHDNGMVSTRQFDACKTGLRRIVYDTEHWGD